MLLIVSNLSTVLPVILQEHGGCETDEQQMGLFQNCLVTISHLMEKLKTYDIR